MSHQEFNSDRTLLLASVKPATAILYMNGVNQFLSWVRYHKCSLSSSNVDQLLSIYFHYLYSSHGSQSSARNALYGLKFIQPHLRDHLLLSERALKGWQRLHPSKQHTPLTLEATILLAFIFSRQGHLQYALAVLLSFDCYLRVSELTSLRIRDIIVGASIGNVHSGVSLVLRQSKRGQNQSVAVRMAPLCSILAFILQRRGARPDDKLFSFSSFQFRDMLHTAISVLGLGSLSVTPHSLRHGGATLDFLRGFPLDDILTRGRWSSVGSARHYIQEGPALLSLNLLDPSMRRDASKIASNILLFIFPHLNLHQQDKK